MVDQPVAHSLTQLDAQPKLTTVSITNNSPPSCATLRFIPCNRTNQASPESELDLSFRWRMGEGEKKEQGGTLGAFCSVDAAGNAIGGRTGTQSTQDEPSQAAGILPTASARQDGGTSSINCETRAQVELRKIHK